MKSVEFLLVSRDLSEGGDSSLEEGLGVRGGSKGLRLGSSNDQLGNGFHFFRGSYCMFCENIRCNSYYKINKILIIYFLLIIFECIN